MNTDSVKDEIKSLALKNNLEFVAIFGSQATGRTHEKSDIDIAVISRDTINIPNLMQKMSEIFKKEDVQVINLAHASPTLMYAVVKDGKILYENGQDVFLNWKLYAIRIWMETKWLRDLRDKKLVEWANKIA